VSLGRLREAVEAEGGELAAALAPDDREDPTAEDLAIELIREGYLLHYYRGRVVSTKDPDFALLAGDRMYALGLARLADRGDLEAVAELADLIAVSAQAHATGDPDRAEAAWAELLSRDGNPRRGRGPLSGQAPPAPR
jgi:hypothetical protein